jgi:threonine dehydrogenase-like Zn-dependent dehydrogenase
MRALRYDGRLWLNPDEPAPIPAADEALLRVRFAGICHTDLELSHGYMDFQGILGHEFVADVVEGPGLTPGTRVVGEINIACGQCDLCRRGMPSQCRNRSTLGIRGYPGTFADLMRLPVRNLIRVPDSVPDTAAVFTEPLAAALQVPATCPIAPTDRVVLIGAGKLGLLCAQVLKLTGCDLTVIVRADKPLSLCQQWGIRTVDARRTPDWLRAYGPQSADVVVDCTGNAEGFALALDVVRPRGAIVLKSTYTDLPTANLTRVVVDEVRVIGSRCGPFDAALRLMESGLVDVESLIVAEYPLAEAERAFAHAAERGVLKVLLRP